MIQSGRGVARVIAPLTAIGLFLSTACLLFNYHLAPWGEGYRDALIEYVKEGSVSQARNVLYHNPEDRRTWMVGRFPYEYAKGSPLRDIQITTKNEAGRITSRFYAPFASWNLTTREWRFQSPEILHMDAGLMPLFEKPKSPLIIKDWHETPWQIVNPGLQAIHLGIPGLHSWLKENKASEWVDRRPFLTQWHHRWAQPWVCLVVVLLGAPLGIVFTRRGVAGGVAVAVFLSAMMLFCTEVFLALGDSGYLPPLGAAWGTNILFTLIALLLLWRRASGRPIYQSLKTLLPSGE
jgi:lipopolysaccharide export LptBFGC system permease protein LptF